MANRQYRQMRHETHRNLIVGGQLTEQNEFPYFVLVGDYCGGALIAPDIVLTAGHCKPKKHEKVHVQIGAYRRTKKLSGANNSIPSVDNSRSFAIEKSTRHFQYHRLGDDEFRYDFALLKLDGRSTKEYIAINRDNSIPVQNATVTAMGMGDTDKHYLSKSEILRKVDLFVVGNEECAATQGRNISYLNRIDPISHMCTYAQGKDSCSYDSGSPIILPSHSLLVGLVSWGEECADDVFPAVNSRVSGASDWIDQNVCEWSAEPPPDFSCSPAMDEQGFEPDVGGILVVQKEPNGVFERYVLLSTATIVTLTLVVIKRIRLRSKLSRFRREYSGCWCCPVSIGRGDYEEVMQEY